MFFNSQRYSDQDEFTFAHLPSDIKFAMHQSVFISESDIKYYRPCYQDDLDFSMQPYYHYFIIGEELYKTDPIKYSHHEYDRLTYVYVDNNDVPRDLIWPPNDHDHFPKAYVLRPTLDYYEILKRPYQIEPVAPLRPKPKPVPIEDIIRSKQPKTDYQLTVHYQRYVDGKAENQKHAYYRIIDSKQDHHLGMLGGDGKDTKQNMPPGPVKVYYGLTREDADSNGKQVIKKDHDKLVDQLKQKLDAIIAKTKVNAAKQKAALQKESWYGEGWTYTEAFFKGLGSGMKDLVVGVVKTLAMPIEAIDAIGQTIWTCLQQGDVSALEKDFDKLKSEVKATEKDIECLARLLTDPTCLELLVKFPLRYFEAASILDDIHMLGRAAPAIILAIVTFGESSLVEGSSETGVIAKSIGGDKGTIQRAMVRAEDDGVVDKKKSEVNTEKGDDIEIYSKSIAHGHAWYKHVITRKEFPGVSSKEEFHQHIKQIMYNPSDIIEKENGRKEYWDDKSQTYIVQDPLKRDGGTAFKPKIGKRYFDSQKDI